MLIITTWRKTFQVYWCHTLKFLNFRMWLKLKINKQFSHSFKIIPNICFLHREFSVKENKYWLFSKLNEVVLFVLHSCWNALFYCLLSNLNLNSLEFKFELNCLNLFVEKKRKPLSPSLSFLAQPTSLFLSFPSFPAAQTPPLAQLPLLGPTRAPSPLCHR